MAGVELDEGDRNCSPDEMLDKVCWMIADEANRVYPADGKGAVEFIKSLMEGDTEVSIEKKMLIYTELIAEKNNTILTAHMIFQHLQSLGFDPVKRAQREIIRSRENGLDIPAVDWEWLEHSSDFPDNIQNVDER